MGTKVNNRKKNSHYIVQLTKSIGVGYVITFVLFLIFAAILTYTKLPEKIIPVVNSIIMILSITVGAVLMTLNVKSNGWLHGSLVGIFYFIVLALISSLAFETFEVDMYLFLKALISLVTGAIGGMIGVNLK